MNLFKKDPANPMNHLRRKRRSSLLAAVLVGMMGLSTMSGCMLLAGAAAGGAAGYVAGSEAGENEAHEELHKHDREHDD